MHHDPSVPATGLTSEFSTCPPTPASEVPALGAHHPPAGADSFAARILSQLGIPAHMADRSDHGLHVAYEKYKAYLDAC